MKLLLTIKSHKVDFVMNLLKNMSFVEIEIIEESNQEDFKK